MDGGSSDEHGTCGASRIIRSPRPRFGHWIGERAGIGILAEALAKIGVSPAEALSLQVDAFSAVGAAAEAEQALLALEQIDPALADRGGDSVSSRRRPREFGNGDSIFARAGHRPDAARVRHAWSASLLGDDFSRRQGRVSLNPFRHLTPLGTLAILFLPFGWGRPVPVNLYNFAHPRRDYLLTSLAGPAANFLLAAICLSLHAFLHAPIRL